LNFLTLAVPAPVSAFSEFDEVALYRYGNSAQQISGLTGPARFQTPRWNGSSGRENKPARRYGFRLMSL